MKTVEEVEKLNKIWGKYPKSVKDIEMINKALYFVVSRLEDEMKLCEKRNNKGGVEKYRKEMIEYRILASKMPIIENGEIIDPDIIQPQTETVVK